MAVQAIGEAVRREEDLRLVRGRNPLGVKGVGEAGTLCAIPAVVNAVNDALSQIAAPAIDPPATPEKIWRAIRTAGGGAR